MNDISETRAVEPDSIWAALVTFQDVSVLNISKGGVFLEMARPMVIGHNYIFQLVTPPHSVVLEGLVVRCHLHHLEEGPEGSQLPRYKTAVEFKLPADEKVDRLASVIRGNTLGEKRGSMRIKPTGGLKANVARDVFKRVLELSMNTITIESEELLDMDQDWKLLLQYGEESTLIDVSIIQGSRKEGAGGFRLTMEILNTEPDIVNFLRSVLERLENDAQNGSDAL
jgi:hypothetical protein